MGSLLIGPETAAGAGCADETHLTAVDPRLEVIISRMMAAGSPGRYNPSNAASHRDVLTRLIIYQQVSKKSVAMIYERYREMPGSSVEPSIVVTMDVSPLVRHKRSGAGTAYEGKGGR